MVEKSQNFGPRGGRAGAGVGLGPPGRRAAGPPGRRAAGPGRRWAETWPVTVGAADGQFET